MSRNLLGSKTRTSQDASIWLESNSGGRPAGSGCATAGGSGTARGLASSRRVGNVGRLGNCGRREGAPRQTIDSDQLILLLVADWPIFWFWKRNFSPKSSALSSRSQPTQNRYSVQYPPTRELKTKFRSQFFGRDWYRHRKGHRPPIKTFEKRSQ